VAAAHVKLIDLSQVLPQVHSAVQAGAEIPRQAGTAVAASKPPS
jgi:hypothetical protein